MIFDDVSAIAQGIPYTILVTVVGFAIGAVGGIPLALGRRSRFAVARVLARAIIEVLRGIPPIVWIFLIYFGIGNEIVTVDEIPAACLAFGLISSAYLAEIYRGGLSSIHHGQWEASDALGMSHRAQLVDVIGPQVIRQAVPAAATYAVGLIKDSSIAFTIGVTDVVFFADGAAKQSGNPMTPYLIAAVLYMAITIPCAWGARTLDARMRRKVAH